MKFEERPLLEDYDLPEPEQIQLTEREERNIKRNDYRETVQQVESALDEEIIFEKDDSPEPPLFERIEPGFEHISLFKPKRIQIMFTYEINLGRAQQEKLYNTSLFWKPIERFSVMLF